MPFDAPRHNWSKQEIEDVYTQSLDALMGQALEVKRANWPDGALQKSQLLSIKTGGCPGSAQKSRCRSMRGLRPQNAQKLAARIGFVWALAGGP